MRDNAISVIIPTFNGKELLKVQLPQLAGSLPTAAIVVVDNGSSDETVRYTTKLSRVYRNIKLVSLPRNTGFTGGCNAGAQAYPADVFFFLNNDCSLPPHVFTALLDRLDTVHAAQPVVCSADGLVENAGFLLEKNLAKAHPLRNPDLVADYLPLARWDDSLDKFFGITATCLAIRGETFRKLGAFDESFGSYLEDVDLSIRLAKNGHAYTVLTDKFVVHQHMATSSRMGTYKQRHDLANWIRIIRKHYTLSYAAGHADKLLIERLRNVNGFLKGVFNRRRVRRTL